ncbi:MAG: hypothetical protein U0136_07470 [Bdellovibrionota bacterium]
MTKLLQIDGDDLRLLLGSSPMGTSEAEHALQQFLRTAIGRRCRLDEVGALPMDQHARGMLRMRTLPNGESFTSGQWFRLVGEQLELGPRSVEFVRSRLKEYPGYCEL